MSNRHTVLKEKPRSIPGSQTFTKHIALRMPVRWTCRHRTNGSDIEAYVLATDGLQVIAETRVVEGENAYANAELIVEAVNEYGKCRPLIEELLSALDLCLKGNGLSWETQREVESVRRKSRKGLNV